jgi:hypothetical protein
VNNAKFEVEPLNLDSLDVEELEQRLEMATMTGVDAAATCPADCANLCCGCNGHVPCSQCTDCNHCTDCATYGCSPPHNIP